MAYNELIKNFSRIRDYMRDFYVYGFKSRGEYTAKSARSYDDEKRRMESWLGDYMQFHTTREGKNVFISIDSRRVYHNPLYKAWKAKSFTDGDITLHFLLFDILPDISYDSEMMTIDEIMDELSYYSEGFDEPRIFDVSTVRKKLNEYIKTGIVITEKRGKTSYYAKAKSCDLNGIIEDTYTDILDFFSEIAPCGVIGSFLLDKEKQGESSILFKHHYITSAMDMEILCQILMAMQDRRSINIECITGIRETFTKNNIIPLKIMISVQNGRQYLMAYLPKSDFITSYRLDYIKNVSVNDEPVSCYEDYVKRFEAIRPHMWGVTTGKPCDKTDMPGGDTACDSAGVENANPQDVNDCADCADRKPCGDTAYGSSRECLEHVEFVISYGRGEEHIPKRLEREKRCGRAEYLEGNRMRFSADVYNAQELIPWIRTFICRITYISFSDKKLQESFGKDLLDMYEMYDISDAE